MQNAAERGQALIEGLLSYSRISTKTTSLSDVDLNEMARSAVSDLDAQVASVNGRVEIGPLPTVQADPVQMRQLFQNLVSNALKFHRKDTPPLVRISAQPAGERPGGVDGRTFWTISVADNGIGFDERYLDRIFRLFQRIHGRADYEGSGIGLAICRKIVERHGGTLVA